MDLPELTAEIFAHILNKALNHQMAGPKMVFIDGTHSKASGNKRKRRRNGRSRGRKTMMTKQPTVPAAGQCVKRCPPPARNAECLRKAAMSGNLPARPIPPVTGMAGY